MVECRHKRRERCVECASQDTYFRGGTDTTVDRYSEYEFAGSNIRLREGHPDPALSGLVLRPAAFILARQLEYLDWKGLRVLELGAGLGLPGHVAASRGADVAFAEMNKTVAARLGDSLRSNGLQGRVIAADWDTIREPFDAIIGSEHLYDKQRVRSALALCRRLWTGKGPILFTDPMRQRDEIDKAVKQWGPPLTRDIRLHQHADGRVFQCDLWLSANAANPGK